MIFGEYKDDIDDHSWQFSPPDRQSCVTVSLFLKIKTNMIVGKDKDKDDFWGIQRLQDDIDDHSWQFSPPDQQSCVTVCFFLQDKYRYDRWER